MIKIWYQFLFLFSQEKLFLKEWVCSAVPRGTGRCSETQAPGSCMWTPTSGQGWLKSALQPPILDTSPLPWLLPGSRHCSPCLILTTYESGSFLLKMLLLWRHTFAQDITLGEATGQCAHKRFLGVNHNSHCMEEWFPLDMNWWVGITQAEPDHLPSHSLLLKIKTRTRGRRGSRLCPPGDALPLQQLQPCHQLIEVSLQATEGLFAGLRSHWGQSELLQKVQVFLLLKSFNLLASLMQSQLYLKRVKIQYGCFWIKIVPCSRNLFILPCSERFF